ncbi:MAG: FAD/NAD(P)-binding oxidoreductase [Synechococcaceae cyanobacterium]
MSAPTHVQVLIAGGGTGGITLASWLRKLSPELEIAIIEPSSFHDYQSGWVLVAGGFIAPEATRRAERDVLPPGADLIHSKVVGFDPDHNAVDLIGGRRLGYEVLVVALGIELNWTAVEGLAESLGHHRVCSIYSRRTASYTRRCFAEFQGGTAVFTQPATAIKCGGAPQKIMHLAHQQFAERSGVGVNSRTLFCTAQASLFPVQAYSDKMAEIAARHHSEVRYHHDLVAVDGPAGLASFRVREPGQSERLETLRFDLLHVVPPMSAPPVVASSPLAVRSGGTEPAADSGGWVEVDPRTARHVRYGNVFAIGDVGSFPTAKTAAAVRKQAPVVAANVLAVLEGRTLDPAYDGYSACPLITSDHSVMMVEFDYSRQPVSSFLVNPVKERWFAWLLERFGFPWIYWNRMLKAQPHEATYLKPFEGLARRLGLMRWQG